METYIQRLHFYSNHILNALSLKLHVTKPFSIQHIVFPLGDKLHIFLASLYALTKLYYEKQFASSNNYKPSSLTLLFPVIAIWWQCIKSWTFPYLSCLWELSPDSSDRADRVLLAVGVEASQSSFCLAISCTRCSREKCVPRARRRYSWAFLRSSITSANQLDNAGSFVFSSGWRMKFT